MVFFLNQNNHFFLQTMSTVYVDLRPIFVESNFISFKNNISLLYYMYATLMKRIILIILSFFCINTIFAQSNNSTNVTGDDAGWDDGYIISTTNKLFSENLECLVGATATLKVELQNEDEVKLC